MQDLKDLKRCFHRFAHPLCMAGSPALARSGAGAPELRSLGHAGDRGGQAPALRAKEVRLAMRRSGSGAPELRSSAHLLLIVIIL